MLSGWRAKAIQINGKKEAPLSEVLQAATLKDGRSMLDLITKKDRLRDDWFLYVDGFYLPGSSSIKKTVKDNVQIHVLDCPALEKGRHPEKCQHDF
jgi:tagatose-1,6-bisphosphate aldolase